MTTVQLSSPRFSWRTLQLLHWMSIKLTSSHLNLIGLISLITNYQLSSQPELHTSPSHSHHRHSSKTLWPPKRLSDRASHGALLEAVEVGRPQVMRDEASTVLRGQHFLAEFFRNFLLEVSLEFAAGFYAKILLAASFCLWRPCELETKFSPLIMQFTSSANKKKECLGILDQLGATNILPTTLWQLPASMPLSIPRTEAASLAIERMQKWTDAIIGSSDIRSTPSKCHVHKWLFNNKKSEKKLKQNLQHIIPNSVIFFGQVTYRSSPRCSCCWASPQLLCWFPVWAVWNVDGTHRFPSWVSRQKAW